MGMEDVGQGTQGFSYARLISFGVLMYNMVTIGNNTVTWLISLIVVIISQCIHISNQQIVHLKYIQYFLKKL